MDTDRAISRPGIPPFARSEKVSDYAKQCHPVEWRELTIKAADSTTIKLLEGRIPHRSSLSRNVVILYFQGNAASTPPRLPYLSSILKQIATRDASTSINFSIIALSYRGFWTSSGRPSQHGIELDAAAALDWIFANYCLETTSIVVWGQSIGAGVATTAVANLISSDLDPGRIGMIKGILLETPFIDMKSMLIALYPQKFLPYRYLTSFLQSSWDSREALSRIADSKSAKPAILLLQAGSDEIVPADHAGVLQRASQEKGLTVKVQVITGALHTEVMTKAQGRQLIADFLLSIR
jgi:fermentation-respiration switch protein FrsA (DUF1100 family)